MFLGIELKGDGLSFLDKLPAVSSRALEMALDATALNDCKPAVYEEMARVFVNPTRYTMNSLKSTPTRRHNMVAYVWFKDPDRMEDHYLLPQVEGGARKTKGFERALGNKMFVPGDEARVNKYGNISIGQIRQILSVLGRADRTSGYMANITARSAKRNKKVRDYVYITRKYRGMYPGVYERRASGAKGARTGTYRAGQRGRRGGVVRARGLVPIMLVGRQGEPYKALLDFYGVVQLAFNMSMAQRYADALKSIL